MRTLTILASGLITVLCQTHVFAQTSVYHAFPDSAATWYESTLETNTPCSATCNYKLFVDGTDTLIGNYTYNFIYGEYISSWLGPIPCTCYPYEGAGPTIFGFIRHVLSEKKVYALDMGTGYDVLLYDFNLEIGQPLLGYFEFCGIYTVTSIDSVLIGSDYRKKWIFNDNTQGNGAIIEGVGSTHGLFQFCIGPGVSSSLNCFNSGDTVFYSPFESELCAPVSASEIQSEKQHFELFPNPASHQLVVSTNDMNFNVILTIRNLFGDVVLVTSFIGDTEIDVGFLTMGVYIISLQFSNGDSQARLVSIQK